MLGQAFSSMEKSIAKVSEQLYPKLELQEVNTLVQTPETNVQAARDRLRNHQERFEKLSRETKASQICESTGFRRKVSIGRYFRTIHSRPA